MITLRELSDINRFMVENFGGAGVGFKDINLARSLIVSPYQEVFGELLYKTIEAKISIMVYSVIANHVFIAGNKRTGVALLEKLCSDNNIILNCSDEDLIEIAIKLATSQLDREGLERWLYAKQTDFRSSDSF